MARKQAKYGQPGIYNATLPTFSDGEPGALAIDVNGRQLLVDGVPRANKGEQVTTITSSTAETTIITAVAGTFLDLYMLLITNTSATATELTLRDATAGGTARPLYAPAGQTIGFVLAKADALKQAAVNNNWTLTCVTSVASIKVEAAYVKN